MPRMAPYNRHLELDGPTLNRATGVIERALRDGGHLARLELSDHLARGGIAATSQRLAHITMHAELEEVICSGPRRSKHFTYALLAERAPRARRLSRDEALAELTRRYFRSHGPATVRDFVWWSGLRTADAKRGLEMIRARHTPADGLPYWSVDDVAPDRARVRHVQLLPVYDEYLVAYRDRQAVPHRGGGAVPPSGFQHALVVGGQVAGLWKVGRSAKGMTVDVILVRTLTRSDRRALGDAVARYAGFLGQPLAVAIS